MGDESDEDDIPSKKKRRHKRNNQTITEMLAAEARDASDPNFADLYGYYVHQVDKSNFMLKHESEEDDKEQFPIVMR